MKRKLTVTMPDGTINTRTTANDYKFVVAVKVQPESYWATTWPGKSLWGAYRWSTRRDLAEKCANECRKMIAPGRYGFSEVKIIELQPC